MAHTAIWVLVLSLGFAAPVHAASPWPVFKHDGRRTGQTNTLGPQTSAVKWVTLLENFGIQAQLAVAADGTIYSGSVHGDFYAFTPDGSIKWRHRLAKRQITAGAALATDGTIYVASEDGILHALTPRGREAWSFDLGGYAGPPASPAIRNGVLYIGATKFYAISQSGSLQWSYDTGGPIAGPPAIGGDGTIYFPSLGSLFALSPDGSLKWRADGHGVYPLGGAPAIGKRGTVYINTNDGTLHAYARDGTFLWKYATPGFVVDVPSSPAIAKDGTIYFGGRAEYQGQGGYFYALTPEGTLKWQYFAGCAQTAPTIGDDGTIYFGSDWCGAIHALNPDGTEKWTFNNIYDYARTSPVIAANKVLYAGLLAGQETPNLGGLIAIGP